MNAFRIMFVVVLTAAVFQACKKGHKSAADEKETRPERDAFHMTMAEAYHPFKDSANLKPAKSLADKLAGEADAWASSAMPDHLDGARLTDQLKQLKTDCHTFSEHVKAGASDEDLGRELTSLHQRFHAIMEAGHGDGDMKEHDEMKAK